MRFPLLFGGIALALTACAPDTEETLGTTHQAIVNGSPSSAAQDATVLISSHSFGFCSGTLIAPNLVLTARHCVSIYDPMTECGTILGERPAGDLTISIGVDADDRTIVARGQNVYVPTAKSLCSADIALFSLDKDIPNITPAKVSFAAPSESSTGTAVGYGSRSRTTRSDVKILAVGPKDYSYKSASGDSFKMDPLVNEIVTSESTCFGDSGGPLLDADGRIFAIASRGIDRVCADRPAFWTTLGGYQDLIRSAATAVGHPIADAPAGTTTQSGNPAATTGEPATATNADSSPATRGGSKKTDATEAGGSAPAAAGCSTTPGASRSPWVALVGLVIAFAALRRRSSARPSSPR